MKAKILAILLLALIVLPVPSIGQNDRTERVHRQLLEGSCTIVAADGDEAPAWCVEDRPVILVTDRRILEGSRYYRQNSWTITRSDWPDVRATVQAAASSWQELAFFWRESALPRGCRLRPLQLAYSLPRKDETLFALEEQGTNVLEGHLVRSPRGQYWVSFEDSDGVAAGTAIVDSRCRVVGICGNTRKDRSSGDWQTVFEPIGQYRAALDQVKRQVREDSRRR